VQREHELPVDVLVKGMLLRQILQFGHELRVFTQHQACLGQRPDGAVPQSGQPAGLLVQPVQVAHVREGLAAP
jgi:hypothetical protein